MECLISIDMPIVIMPNDVATFVVAPKIAARVSCCVSLHNRLFAEIKPPKDGLKNWIHK
jgi:hypothetical protein